MQQTGFEDDSFDTIIAHQVLEHISDDAAAIKESHRILGDGGTFIFSVPIVLSWDKTLQSEDVKDAVGRKLYYGQSDHFRFYGQDIGEKFESVGFELFRFIAEEPFVARHGLIRGDVVFFARKDRTRTARGGARNQRTRDA